MLDALGFKGIWRREGVSSGSVLSKLKSIEKAGGNFIDEIKKRVGGEMKSRIEVMCLSDTIAVGVWPPNSCDDVVAGPDVLFIAAGLASLIMREAVLGDFPHFAYRGAIAVGDFEFDNRFLVGPAIDEAAELMELAEASVVWLAPSARVIAECSLNGYCGQGDGALLVPVRVPVKGGCEADVIAVSPLWVNESNDLVFERILATFDRRRFEVEIKFQNTERILRLCRDAKVGNRSI